MCAGGARRIIAGVPIPPRRPRMLLILVLAAAGTLIPSTILSIADQRPRSAS
jgi:hypothetical protein